MSRVKIQIPSEKAQFEIPIPLRITDMNYGNHLANDRILSIFHEARVQALAALSCTELDIGDKVSLIMGDVMIRFRAEGFYGDLTYVRIWIREFKTHAFQIYYQLIAKNESEEKIIAEAKTGMVAFDYNSRKVCKVPKSFIEKCS